MTHARAENLDGFRELARSHRVIPVTRTLLADGLTAIGLFETLCGDRAGTFLLESAEAGRSWSRYSFVGVRSVAMLTEEDGQALWSGRVPVGLPTHGSAWDVLRESVQILQSSHESNEEGPRLTSGFVGSLAYDVVREFEELPDSNPDALALPEVAFLLASDMAVLDHFRGTVTLIASAINFDASDERVDEAWQDAINRLDAMERSLATPRGVDVSTFQRETVTDVRALSDPTHFSDEEYRKAVLAAKDHIRSGDIFQVVLSQKYSLPVNARSLDVYRILRSSNPSPYMYLIRFPAVSKDHEELSSTSAFDVVGSSPEALVTVHDGRCTVHPIAGTRPRGRDTTEDQMLARELLADEKERAEHVMLVDLARNDLGRVCSPGSVEVVEFMEVERYSHVMHIVSTVTGALNPDASALDALQATFPAGTLSGAPKVRAMEIIDELEPQRRGLYGGVVGYVDFRGNLDVAIAIRTAVICNGIAHIQAGAGVVADSDPAAESQECANKAGAVLSAVRAASTLKPVTFQSDA